MRISNDIHEWADEYANSHACDYNELHAFADRIDAETVELPKDRDGVPINVGDTVWFVGRDDVELKVDHITFFKDKTKVDAISEGHVAYSNPTDFTHECPDSWDRIADELDAWCDGADVDGDACWKPRDLAKRIRKMAKREGE